MYLLDNFNTFVKEVAWPSGAGRQKISCEIVVQTELLVIQRSICGEAELLGCIQSRKVE